MAELSVIIPFVLEYPQVVFTVQNIVQELRDRVDFEIIVVDNYCKMVEEQNDKKVETCGVKLKEGWVLNRLSAFDVVHEGKPLSLAYKNDKAVDCFEATTKTNKWLKVLRYDKALSHWQCKNEAIKASTGKFLWFVDSHCIVARDVLFKMFDYYKANYQELHGTINLPLTYKILDPKKLIYKLVCEEDKGLYHYSFSAYRDDTKPYRVPCMSMCGSLMTREIYDALGGWPNDMMIYGGGENFVNFTLAVLGYTVNIMPGHPLFHHGEERMYHWYFDHYTRNRIIATYMFGGADLARLFAQHCKGDQAWREKTVEEVIETHKNHRALIESRQVMTIQDWANQWR